MSRVLAVGGFFLLLGVIVWSGQREEARADVSYPPYVITSYRNIDLLKLNDQGCEIYILHDRSNFSSDSIALGRGCR